MADYQFHASILERCGVSVVALSTDDLEHAKDNVYRSGATFPVIYGVDGPALAEAWGAFYEERRNVLHATSFLLRPGGVIASATYSTGPIGRLTAQEAARMALFLRKQDEAKK